MSKNPILVRITTMNAKVRRPVRITVSSPVKNSAIFT
jgi:hypothetical protein